MSLKDIYYKLEDKYFKTLDKLENKGINLYKVIDPLEKKGIPTFVIFNLIILGIILLLVFNIGSFYEKDIDATTLTITFKDDTGNAISNETINFSLNDANYSLATDSEGVLQVKDLDPNNTYQFSLNDSRYSFNSSDASKNIDLNLKNSKEYIISRLKETITKKIYFKTQNNELIQDTLNVSFSCLNNTDFSKVVSVFNGETTLEIPSDCGQLITNISNSNYISEDESLEINEETGEIFLSESEQEYGDLHISILDEDNGIGLDNINISILNQNNIEIDSAVSNNNGQITFENLPVGFYYVLASDPEGIYSSLTQEQYSNGEYQLVEVVENSTTNFDIYLKKEIVGFFNLKIIDQDTLEAIENVEVKVSKNSEFVASNYTDETGKVLFGLKENVPYTLTLDHKDYVIKTKTLTPSINKNQVEELTLRILDQASLQGVFVSVVDKSKNPVEYADIVVWNTQTNSIVKTLSADIRGQASISNLDTDEIYQIEASTGTYSGKTNPFRVEEREPKNITLALDIGEGTYNLNIVDNVGQPMSTTVKIYDVLTNQELEGKRTTTDNEGNTLIRLRADRVVYFVIDNYDSKFITKKYDVKANTTTKLNLKLPMVSNNSNIQFLGLYDSKGNLVNSLSSGQAVKAKFILNVGSNYSSAQAHIRTGKGTTCDGITHSLEEDSLYIKEINFAGSKIVGSTTYTPCLGQAKDLSNLTKRNGKWFNAIIENPIVGSYLIEADLVIKSTATGNLPLFFRSQFSEGNTILRSPEDIILGTNMTSSEKQGLYAYSNEATIYTGASTFCNNSLCYYLSIKDKTTNITKNIIDKYNAKENNNYSLSFKFNFDSTLPNAYLRVKSVGNTISLNKYIITGVGSQNLSGEDLSNIDLGNLNINDHINGTIDLSILDDQSDSLEISVISNNEVVFTKKVNFEIEPSKKLNVEIVPSVFVPFINNDVIVTIRDEEENPISLADVIVKVNGKTINTGQSGKSGIYAFSLPALDLSDQVDIIIKKQSYQTVIFTKVISNNLITTTPEELDLKLDLSKEYSKTASLNLFNKTILPLAIENISTNIDEEYLNVSISSSDILLQPSQSLPLDVTVTISEKGLDLMSQKIFKGDLLIKVNDSTLDKTWVVKIPLTIRITFGNSVDNLDCLELDPVLQNIRGDGSKQTSNFNLDLINNCRVDDYPIALNNIYAKLDWDNDPIIGDIYIISNNEEIKLVPNKNILIAKLINSSSTENIKIRFDSKKVEKASSNPKIIFSTRRPNINGVDEISSTLNLGIVINNYTACVKIPQNLVTALYCPLNNLALLGNDFTNQLYNNNFGYNPYSYNQPSYNNMMQYNNQYIANPQHNSIFSPFPSYSPSYNAYMGASNYFEPNTMNAQNMQLSNYFMCPQTRIPIENNCEEDVKIKLDTDYGYSLEGNSEFTINKGDRYDVKVQGGAQFGIFEMGVRAKSNVDSDSDYSFVGNIPIQVTEPMEQIPEECIIVNPTTFDFSKIKIDGDGTQQLEVINLCVSLGYRIKSVGLKELEPLDIEIQGQKIEYFSIKDINNKPMSEVEKVERKLEDGSRIEAMVFEIRRSPEIQKIQLNTDSRSIAEWITNLRTNQSIVGNQIELKPMLAINYLTPTNQSKTKNQRIVLKDSLQWLGILDSEMDTGAKEVIKYSGGQAGDGASEKTKEETTKLRPEKTEKAEKAFKDTKRKDGSNIEFFVKGVEGNKQLHIKIPEIKDKDLTVSPQGASICYTFSMQDLKDAGLDKITKTSKLKNEGVIYNGQVLSKIFRNKEDSSKVDVCLHRTLEKLDEESRTIGDLDNDQGAFFSDPENTSQTQKFSITKKLLLFNTNVYKDLTIGLITSFEESEKFTTAGNLEYITDNFSANRCYDPKGFIKDEGLTGKENYKKYGFNRLLFNWDPKDIDYQTFDLGRYYTDEDQLRMTITHKLNSENYTDKLSDGIEFIKLDSGKIANVKNIDHIDLDCDFASISCDNCTTTSDYYEYLKDLLNNNIPDELKKYTILDFTYTESNKDKFNDEFKTFVSPVGGEKKGFINNYLDLLESKGVTDSNLKTIEKILEENNNNKKKLGTFVNSDLVDLKSKISNLDEISMDAQSDLTSDYFKIKNKITDINLLLEKLDGKLENYNSKYGDVVKDNKKLKILDVIDTTINSENMDDIINHLENDGEISDTEISSQVSTFESNLDELNNSYKKLQTYFVLLKDSKKLYEELDSQIIELDKLIREFNFKVEENKDDDSVFIGLIDNLDSKFKDLKDIKAEIKTSEYTENLQNIKENYKGLKEGHLYYTNWLFGNEGNITDIVKNTNKFNESVVQANTSLFASKLGAIKKARKIYTNINSTKLDKIYLDYNKGNWNYLDTQIDNYSVQINYADYKDKVLENYKTMKEDIKNAQNTLDSIKFKNIKDTAKRISLKEKDISNKDSDIKEYDLNTNQYKDYYSVFKNGDNNYSNSYKSYDLQKIGKLNNNKDQYQNMLADILTAINRNISIINGTDTQAMIDAIKNYAENKNELKNKIEDKDNSLDPSAEQYEENFKAIEDYYNFLKNQTIDINYNTYDGGDNKKHYQTTVYDYLNKVDNYVSYLEKVQKNTEKEKIKTIQNFTKDLLDSLDIYYGSGRNSFIVNIKDFKALSDDLGDKENKTTTKEVFSSEIFLRDFYKLDPVKDYTDRDLDIGTYIISLSNVDTENKKANITFNSINNSKLTNAIDIYNNKEDLKNNLFFKYPINASYYIHSNIPFNRRGSPLGMNESSLIDSKNYTTNRYFEDIQKGYVLSLEDNLYKLNLNYADIRPIQLITNYPFSYKIDYVLSDELIPLTSTQKWKATYNNRDIYKSYNIDKETTYTLNKIQGKDTLFRNTYFVYNKLNTTSNNQLELSSTINLNPSLEEIRSEKLTDSLSENFLYSYMVPKELNSNSLTFEKIIDNIENKNICFNIEDQKMNFWINPAKPDSFIDLKMSNEE